MAKFGMTGARKILGDKRLINFLRFINEKSSKGEFMFDVLAVKLINEKLDRGQSLDELFDEDSDFGYQLRVFKYNELHYRIEFGCQAGPMAGDGATWDVWFNQDGSVSSAEMISFWIS
ncbi:MAG: hypothetical protein QME85_10365 [Candidatus Saccharicenans sp.]|nr:hypothetical protein [Candidatus Saccharicenans sp.]